VGGRRKEKTYDDVIINYKIAKNVYKKDEQKVEF
jgi:hypothetical protein